MRVETVEEENSYSLIIENCLATDSGAFSLKAKNLLAEVSTNSLLTVQSPPAFVKELSLASSSSPTTTSSVEIGNLTLTKISTNDKSQLKLECQVTGFPKPTIKWFKNDDEIKTNEKFKLENKLENYSLLIKDCSNKEKGFYKVIAENTVGSETSQIIVDVNNMPSFIKSLSNVDVILGEITKLEFSCIYQSKPKAEVTWLFGDKVLNDSDEDSHYLIFDEVTTDDSGNEINVTKLIIQNITLEDSGALTCKLKNSVGELSSHGILSVLTPPLIIKNLPKVLDLNEKAELKIECLITDSIPKATVSWKKDGNSLATSKRIIISKPVPDPNGSESSLYSLTVIEPLIGDSGIYTVIATNKVATVESNSEVNILSAPKIVKDLKSSIECSEGDKLELEVSAIGKPTPEFKWYHFNNETNSEVELISQEGLINTRIESDKLFILELSKLTKEMQGKYTLKLINPAGSVETSCNLVVNGNKHYFSKMF